jgi:hypothetical protein
MFVNPDTSAETFSKDKKSFFMAIVSSFSENTPIPKIPGI